MPKKQPEAQGEGPPKPAAKKAAQKKETATAAEVLRELTDIGLGRRAFVAIDRQGNAVDHPASVPERIRALELLAKYHKLMGTTPEQPVQPVRILDDIEERIKAADAPPPEQDAPCGDTAQRAGGNGGDIAPGCGKTNQSAISYASGKGGQAPRTESRSSTRPARGKGGAADG